METGSTFFASVFNSTDRPCLPGPESGDPDCRNINFSFVNTEILMDKLCQLNEFL